MSKWHVQSRLSNTGWWTEESYATQEEAVCVCAELRVREPTNDDGEEIEYRIFEIL